MKLRRPMIVLTLPHQLWGRQEPDPTIESSKRSRAYVRITQRPALYLNQGIGAVSPLYVQVLRVIMPGHDRQQPRTSSVRTRSSRGAQARIDTHDRRSGVLPGAPGSGQLRRLRTMLKRAAVRELSSRSTTSVGSHMGVKLLSGNQARWVQMGRVRGASRRGSRGAMSTVRYCQNLLRRRCYCSIL